MNEAADTLVPSPTHDATTIDTVVLRQAARTPEAVAVAHAGQELTYAELINRAAETSRWLADEGVRPGDVVGLLMDRSASFVVMALGVLMAGGAYLPLDRRQPEKRLRWMVADADAVLVLTDGPATRGDWIPGVPLAQAKTTDGPVPEAGVLPAIRRHPGDLAYVMYTSGSTGRPKGVATTHHNLVDFVQDPHWIPEHQARVLAYSPLGFDSSTYELWVPLALGGRAVVWAPEAFDVGELREVITQQGVTAVYFTTALFDAIAHEDASALAPLREVITGGDVLSEAGLRRVIEHCPETTVVHAYGPTETTVFCSLQLFAPTQRGDTRLNLGTPMAHTKMFVLGDTLDPVAPGETGELYVTGMRLARGYLRSPGQTAQRFLPDPHGPPGGRMYRTGDLARQHEEGFLTFAGRVDRQVKLRGFRVEPGEIEAALRDLPGVAQAVVSVRDDLPGGRGLAAYVVPSRRNGEPSDVDVENVLRQLGEVLPRYLVPSAITVLPRLPLTANGKLDTSALPRPARMDPQDRQGLVARSPLEDQLCKLFTEILQCPPVGVDHNFFRLGGQSLLAIRLIARIRAETDREVAIRDLFRHPTVARLAAHLSSGSTDPWEA